MPTIKEVQEELQNLTNLKIKQIDLANALGTTKSNISLRIKNGSMATLSEIKKIVTFLGIPGAHNVLNALLQKENRLIEHEIDEAEVIEHTPDTISVDFYPDVFGSCGSGSFVFSENKEVIDVPRRSFKCFQAFKKYSVINATGDSMQPHILDKDRLIVEHWTGEQIRDNKIYVFRFHDNIFIKRLVLNLDQIIVKSDNKEYPARHIERGDLDNFQLIGRIVGIMREED